MKKKRIKKPKRANINHIAHQVGVSGVGAHKNKKRVIPRKRKNNKGVCYYEEQTRN